MNAVELAEQLRSLEKDRTRVGKDLTAVNDEVVKFTNRFPPVFGSAKFANGDRFDERLSLVSSLDLKPEGKLILEDLKRRRAVAVKAVGDVERTWEKVSADARAVLVELKPKGQRLVREFLIRRRAEAVAAALPFFPSESAAVEATRSMPRIVAIERDLHAAFAPAPGARSLRSELAFFGRILVEYGD